MQVTSILRARDRAEWRDWLTSHHATASEIWLVSRDRNGEPTVSYLDSVEEAICFGWIDGLAKRIPAGDSVQRFTPRRKRSHWTELNKARARRLIALGLMTDAGLRLLPDLKAPFEVGDDILAIIDAEPLAKRHFETFPELYVRVRLGYIEEVRRQPEEFARRLNSFIRKTAAGEMFGNWNDGGRLI